MLTSLSFLSAQRKSAPHYSPENAGVAGCATGSARL
jgi:hypothetical protein